MSEQKSKNKDRTATGNFMMEFFVLLALIPSLFKTDWQMFLMTLPIIMILTGYLITTKRAWMIVAFIILIWMYGGNSSDYLGKPLYIKLETAGIIGISNLLIISASMILYKRSRLRIWGFKLIHWKSMLYSNTVGLVSEFLTWIISNRACFMSFLTCLISNCTYLNSNRTY